MERRTATFVLIGLLLVVVAGLSALAMIRQGGPGGEGDVVLRIDGPRDMTLYNGSVPIQGEENSVLAALETASRRDGFIVETKDYGELGIMVVQIFGHRAQGNCGWAYEVNDVSGDRSAHLWRLSDGDDVHWLWTCHTG